MKNPENTTDGDEERENLVNSETETDDGQSSNTNCDQDSDISSDEEIDNADIEEEDWIEKTGREAQRKPWNE